MTPRLSTMLQQALDLLDSSDRRRVYLLLALTIVTAVVEIVGIGSVAPFIALLTDPDMVTSNPFVQVVSERLGIADRETLLLIMAGIVIGVTLLRNALFLFHLWLNSIYIGLIKHNLASRLLRAYLSQPYTFYLARSTVELQRNVIEETVHVVEGVIQPLITALTRFIIIIAIVAFLVYLRPMVALVTLLILGGFYLTIYLFVHGRLQRLSERRRHYRSRRFKLASEGLSGIKPLILSGHQLGYAREFARVSRVNALAEAMGRIIAAMPRYAIESLAIVGMTIFATVEFRLSDGNPGILPLMALYLLAGYRLLPALQILYGSISRIKFDSASLGAVHQELASLTDAAPAPAQSGFRFSDEIRLTDVTYRYAGKERPAISGVSLTLPANGSFAVVGRSGSGKSTLVDLVLGLIQPQQGEVLVDGEPAGSAGRNWQGQIGYVPQHIYLADDSVSQNIAFGVDPAEIDRDAVVRAARIADIHDHIENELEHGYDTVIGERGIRLSGGQRQRIGIARALYLDPTVLVLDEATSALDSTTENVIMEAIHRLGQEITVILIAHRMTTVASCDWIYVLSDGRLVDQGKYQDLEAGSAAFRELTLIHEDAGTGQAESD